ncbi:amidohydrolase [Caulobacter sp. SL161]|uniref:amidohydrolase n=1 Tax=Caulobacter sp. SL161 TaxID=2995156 RepID=UPI0022743E17|nr:amidohydrolase [Caulobacter sp. SL161]MCY1646620.1 amidohydrolase [Caulobacter sp. SL161]
MRRRTLALSAMLLLSAASTALAQSATPADTVFRNGYVYTVDGKDSVQQALAVRDGKIVFVGSNAAVAKHVGPKTRNVDLKGRMLMPGLVDGHSHPLAGGSSQRACNLDYLPLTEAEFLERIQACLDKAKAGDDDILVVGGWYRQFMRPKGVNPTAATLDRLRTKRPVVVRNRDGHSILLNSRALALAEIDDKTPNPPGGKIVRDGAGRATGILEDGAGDLIGRKLPAPTEQDALEDGRAAFKYLASHGVTSLLDAAASEPSLEIYKKLAAEGAMTARVHAAMFLGTTRVEAPAETVAWLKTLRARYDDPSAGTAPTLRVDTAKMFLDGVIQAPAQTARLTEPYWTNHGDDAHPVWGPGEHLGELYTSPAQLKPMLLALGEAGLNPHIHAIGDGAVRVALDGYEALRQAHPGLDIRPAIAHTELVEPADYPRFKALNVAPVMSYQWSIPAPNSVTGAKNYLGPERFERMEPFDKLQAAGATLAYGSDWPVDRLNYWLALQASMTRAGDGTYGDEFAGRLNSAPGLTRAQALRSITYNSSWQVHQDKTTGSLEVGKLADLIVLDRNVMTVPVSEVSKTKVLMTMIGGKVVYDAGVVRP